MDVRVEVSPALAGAWINPPIINKEFSSEDSVAIYASTLTIVSVIPIGGLGAHAPPGAGGNLRMTV